MYYRVAIQVDAAPTWQWKSTVLSELSTLFHFLRLFRTLPHDQLRVFSSSSRQGLAEQLEQENKGLASTSVTAAHFLQGRLIPSQEGTQGTPERDEGAERRWQPSLMGAIAARSQAAVDERGGEGSVLESRGRSALERRREALESRPGGDHDLPYRFSLPRSMPQVLAWMTLLARVQRGELRP